MVNDKTLFAIYIVQCIQLLNLGHFGVNCHKINLRYSSGRRLHERVLTALQRPHKPTTTRATLRHAYKHVCEVHSKFLCITLYAIALQCMQCYLYRSICITIEKSDRDTH